MSTLAQRSDRPELKPPNEERRDPKSMLDMGKVKIVPLPRRNDDIYMRTLRRRRA